MLWLEFTIADSFSFLKFLGKMWKSFNTCKIFGFISTKRQEHDKNCLNWWFKVHQKLLIWWIQYASLMLLEETPFQYYRSFNSMVACNQILYNSGNEIVQWKFAILTGFYMVTYWFITILSFSNEIISIKSDSVDG